MTPFLPIEASGKLAIGLLDERADLCGVLGVGEQMHVIAGDALIEQVEHKSGHPFPQSVPIIVTISSKVQEELAVMTTVCEVVNVTGDEIAIGPWHEPVLRDPG